MVLPRLGHAIRSRDWAGVTTELVVVVLGIFIALQADNWNQVRLRVHEEARIHEALISDFLELREQISGWIDGHSELARSQTVVATALVGGEVPDGEEAAFRQGLQSLVHSIPPPQNSGTLEGLIATGDLASLSDPELRRLLFRFQEYLETVERQMIKFDDLLHTYKVRTPLAIEYEPLPFARADLWQVGPDEAPEDRPATGTENKVQSYDLLALRSNPQVGQTFVEAADVHLAAVQWGLRLRQYADGVLNRLRRLEAEREARR